MGSRGKCSTCQKTMEISNKTLCNYTLDIFKLELSFHFQFCFNIILNKRLKLGKIILNIWKKQTWDLSYFNQFICRLTDIDYHRMLASVQIQRRLPNGVYSNIDVNGIQCLR